MADESDIDDSVALLHHDPAHKTNVVSIFDCLRMQKPCCLVLILFQPPLHDTLCVVRLCDLDCLSI
jgi:hypothetical protein